MIVRTLKQARDSSRRVCAENWESARLVLRDDRVGFSFHITTIYAGTETPIWYKNHFESVYCIRGEGEIVDLDAETTHPIAPGTIYILDANDRHLLRAKTELELACVFNPALRGDETHDPDGAYPLEIED
jgi:L-ectoine synthase